MAWEPSLASQQHLFVARVGLLQGEARVYLQAQGEDAPHYVIRLIGVFKFSDSLPRGRVVQITDHFPHGSFGWDIPNAEPHHSVMIKPYDDDGFLLALARSVDYCIANQSEALNWPG